MKYKLWKSNLKILARRVIFLLKNAKKWKPPITNSKTKSSQNKKNSPTNKYLSPYQRQPNLNSGFTIFNNSRKNLSKSEVSARKSISKYLMYNWVESLNKCVLKGTWRILNRIREYREIIDNKSNYEWP